MGKVISLKSNRLWTILTICLLASVFSWVTSGELCVGQIPELGNQEQVEQFLEDHWRLNVEETVKLLPENSMLDIESLQMGVPLFPYSFSFQGDKFEIRDSGVATEYRFQSYDKESGELLLVFPTKVNVTHLQLKLVSEDRLVLQQNLSIVGPLNVVFERRRAPDKAGAKPPAKDPNFEAFAGEWKLNEKLTQSVWEEVAEAATLKYLKERSETLLQSCSQLKIEDSVLDYVSEGTSELVQVLRPLDKGLLLRSRFDQNQIAIEKVGDRTLLLVDPRRNLIAIYGEAVEFNPKQCSPEIQQLINRVGSSIYVDNRGRLTDRVSPKLPSGETSIHMLEISRRWASHAVKSVDLTSSQISLFFNWGHSQPQTGPSFVVRLKRLDAVYDDLGQRLDTAEYRDRIQALDQESVISQTTNYLGKAGPIYSFTVDAPSLGAKSIKQLSGEVDLTFVRRKWVRIADARKKLGEALQHPMLPADAKLRLSKSFGQSVDLHLVSFFIDNENAMGSVFVTDRFGQSIRWDSATGGNTLGFPSLPEYFDVWVQVNDRSETKSFEFQFQDIELPE